jgi:hypothetical protein
MVTRRERSGALTKKERRGKGCTEGRANIKSGRKGERDGKR